MSAEDIQFYVRHRELISEWAKLEKRVDDLMRDAVKQGAQDKAIKLLKGESGDDGVDFYVRNRLLITEWDSLQLLAGQALHSHLVDAARAAGCPAHEGKMGWTGATFRTPDFDQLREEQNVWIELAWTRQHLLTTRRGYPFPRLALVLPPRTWKGESRHAMAKATRPIARELGMTKKDNHWVHWGMLNAISESQDLPTYAAECVARLRNASELLYPVVVDAISATAALP